jgi:hypothetical protein
VLIPFPSDAQRPCSTCVRSHAHALSHAPAGVILPERPECTFDEGNVLFFTSLALFFRPKRFKPSWTVASSAGPEAPKNRYEKLENRISSYILFYSPIPSLTLYSLDELEAMLRDQNSPSANKSSKSSLSPPATHPATLPTSSGFQPVSVSAPSGFHSLNAGLPQCYQSPPFNFTGMITSSENFISLAENHPEVVNIPSINSEPHDPNSFLTSNDLFWPGWPSDLPPPSLVRHL